MGLDRFVIATVVFILIVVSGIGLIVDINNKYDDVNIDTNTFSDVNLTGGTTYNLSQDISTTVLTGDVDTDVAEGSIFATASKAITNVWNVFSTVGKIMSAIAKAIGIPKIYVTFGFTALSIFLIFAVIFLIFRVRA